MIPLETVVKNKILKCQLDSSDLAGFPEQTCTGCTDRFVCFTLRARKFEVTEFLESWVTFEVIAENIDDARELFPYCGKKVGSGWSDGNDIVVEEVSRANMDNIDA